MYECIEELEIIEKFNPYHDTKGRFTHAGGASSFTIRTRAGYQQGQANRAIEREKQKADKPSSKPLRNPTGDYKKDLKTEWENADYAVQFKSDGTSVGIIELHSERRTGANGDESWAEGAYGNAKILTEYGSHGPIYMIDKKSAVEAEQAAYKKAKEKNIEDKGEITKLLQDEIRQRMLRSIDKEYIDEQTKKRIRLRRQRGVGKSAGDYDIVIEEIEKFNPYHDSLGRFTTASAASSFTIRTRGGAYQQGMVNRAIEREKQRTKEKKTLNRKEKNAKNIKDYIKHQVNIDIENYRDETTRRFDNSKLVNVDWKKMSHNQQNAIKGLKNAVRLHPNGAWMMGIEYLKNKR